MITSLYDTYQWSFKGLKKYKKKIHIQIENQKYILKTADNVNELKQAFRLRNDVFFCEFFIKRKLSIYDIDRHDKYSDHLVIISKETEQVIGTYRILSSDFPSEFYSNEEFELNFLHKIEGPILELGRACIAKDHRKGAVIHLLWRGIAEYMQLTGAKSLFGCSSIRTQDPKLSALIYKYFIEKESVHNQIRVPVKKFYEFPNFDFCFLYYNRKPLTELEIQEAEEKIPSLLKSYIKMGAHIISQPALDRNFQCIDFLTLLNVEKLSGLAKSHFRL